MTTSTFDESQRKAARVAGFFYLLTFVIVVAVNFGINERLMVAGNPAQTARNILAHERLFRIGIASNLVYEAGLLATFRSATGQSLQSFRSPGLLARRDGPSRRSVSESPLLTEAQKRGTVGTVK